MQYYFSSTNIISLAAACVIGIFCILPTGYADEVYLNNGDRYSGEVVTVSEDIIILKTSSAGEISIDRKHVSRVEPAEIIEQKSIVAKEPEQEKRWSGELGAGYSLATGNTENSQLDGHVAAKWSKDPHELDLKAEAIYGSQDKKMNTQKYYEKARYSRGLGEERRWNIYAQEEADHDRFADIHGRFTPSLGFGYWIAKKPEFKLLTETGIGVTYTNYRTRESTTEAVLIPRVYSEAMIGKLKMTEDFTLYPALSDLGEYRWKSESALEYPLSASLAARLSAINEYNSSAPAGNKKSDWRIISTLLQKF